MIMRRALGAALLTTGVLLSTVACSSFAGSESSAATPSSSSTASTSSSSTSSSATTSTTASSSSASASSTPGGPLDTSDSGRTLTLADFFSPQSYWQERRFDIADKTAVQGIGTTVSNCGSAYGRELELRLGNKFSELTFSAAQANDSQSSDQKLVVEVLANNQQVEIRSVPFNQVQDFRISVDGVNALKIRLYLDETVPRCGGSVNGVITGATVS